MFEKEAEEYLFDRLDPKAIDSVSEFSNKHIEEAIVSSFQNGAEFGYNKANEWHYVKDGDLPSEEDGWVCNQDGIPCYFDWSTEQWLDCEGTQIRTTEWCHMPHKE